MYDIYVKDLIDHCNCKLLIGNLDQKIKNCFINSKEKSDDGTFFGILGERVDGSCFYKEAFNNGAKVCVISKAKDANLEELKDKTIVISSDVKKTLMELAKYKRSLFKGKVIGITGSVGKTSTKELISSVLESKYKVLKTKGNHNSQIGLPLTILRLADEDIMVLEMGMSNLNEIHNLSLISKPDIAIITNVYSSHIGNLKSRDNILKAKLEILDGMKDGTLIINNDNDLLNESYPILRNKYDVITIGINNRSDAMPIMIEEGTNSLFSTDDIFDIKVKGSNKLIYNALMAIVVGKKLGIDNDTIKDKINDTKEINHRLEMINLKDDITLIDDTYNASLESIESSINYLSNFNKRKVLILGDVLELGKESKKIHKKIGYVILKNNIDVVITIGKYSKYVNKIVRKAKIINKHFKYEYLSYDFIDNILTKDDVILIKGSNGMNLVNIVNHLKKKDLS